MQESNMYYNAFNSVNGTQPSLNLLTEGHHITEINNHESDTPNGQKGTNKSIVKATTPTSHVEQADMRRMLQARQHEQVSYPYQPHVLYAPGMYAIDTPRRMQFPTRETNMHNLIYRVSNHGRVKSYGSLMD